MTFLRHLLSRNYCLQINISVLQLCERHVDLCFGVVWSVLESFYILNLFLYCFYFYFYLPYDIVSVPVQLKLQIIVTHSLLSVALLVILYALRYLSNYQAYSIQCSAAGIKSSANSVKN